MPERDWNDAIERWLAGDPEPVAALLRSEEPQIPREAREFLARLALGKLKKKRGPKPHRYSPGSVDDIVAIALAIEIERYGLADFQGSDEQFAAEYELAKQRGPVRSKVAAIEAVANRIGVSSSVVERALYRKASRPDSE